MSDPPFDAIIVVSFGGPEGPDDVMPFLENVLRGKNVPPSRMLEVAQHYNHFGGVSPINQQNRDLIAALEQSLADHQIELPVYWGNRNWHPSIPDALQQMQRDGIGNALAFFTSAYSCYSGCRQYRENIMAAQVSLGDNAPQVHKLRMFFNHPSYIAASADRVGEALAQIPEQRRPATHFVFTAHSIPMAMAEGCSYTTQLAEASRLVMEQIGDQSWQLVYQSRSGPASQSWLEPDVCDYLEATEPEQKIKDVVIMPIGFVSDHMEVLFDLDTEAQEVCERVGINMVRAKTVGTHPEFISMIRQLILERTEGKPQEAVGAMPPNHDVCPVDCCLPGKRPSGSRPSSASPKS